MSVADAIGGGIVEDTYLRLLEDRIILFNDQVEQDIVEKVIVPLIEMGQDPKKRPIEIWINSMGGSLFDGFVVCNILDNIKVPVTITILGMALSMGMLIAMAGSNNPNVTTKCYPFSVGLVHAGSLSLEGNVNDAETYMNFNKKIQNKMKDYVRTHTSVSPEILEEQWKKDWWMDSDDMLEYGIVDEIINAEVVVNENTI